MGRVFDGTPLISAGASEKGSAPFSCFGKDWSVPANAHWKTSKEGMNRLLKSERIIEIGNRIEYKRYLSDFGVTALSNIWLGLGERGFTGRKLYAVQTASEAIERCILMTTDPGDLVFDPTCGSGTTAFAAEKWGRRWITVDTSRVAIVSARQRILSAKYDLYKVRGVKTESAVPAIDPSANFVYKTVPHIELRSIANNTALDSIFDAHEPILESHLTKCNELLALVDDQLRERLVRKLADFLQNEGLRAINSDLIRRWLLPGTKKKQVELTFSTRSKLKPKHTTEYFRLIPPERWEHWTLPFNVDEDWPDALAEAVAEYRTAWRKKMQDINECISKNTEQECLVDQPELVEGAVRVSGPFTVEGVRPEELTLSQDTIFSDQEVTDLANQEQIAESTRSASAYFDSMVQLLRKDGVTFSGNEHRTFSRVEPLYGMNSALHAEALWEVGDDALGEVCNIGIAFGPQHGPVTAEQVEDLIRASRRYDELVIAGFSFDGAAQTVIQESVNPRLKIHMAHIRPDVSPGMDGLLKDSPKSQIFSVFGQPEIDVRLTSGGDFEVELLGVDIYDPISGEIRSNRASKVAAWFLDQDYDGRCFCITQAFFPNQSAWDKIAKAIGSDAEALSQYDGTVSLPFERGKYGRIAVKVIDPRGNEVMAIRKLNGGS
jgi:adenine-specific DNA-methyltransferase